MSGLFQNPDELSDEQLTRKPPPVQRLVDWFHGRASINRREDIHHKLGYGPGDAAPGEDLRTYLLGQGVPGFPAPSAEIGYRYWQQVRFTSNGVFNKADYPGLKAIRVRVQAGGGAGGGAGAAASGQHSKGGGGGGGEYAESFITDIAGLDASIPITVGDGGTGVAGGGGAAGDDSSFGSLVVAEGGGGGASAASSSAAGFGVSGGSGGGGGTGDVLVAGVGGGFGMGSAGLCAGGAGGAAHMGGGGRGIASAASGASSGGDAGQLYGGGGGGAINNSGAGAARPGGDGAPGIVILDLYA